MGPTCCQVVVDPAGASGDHVFLGLSSTFKTMVGWRKDILGKRVAEVVAEIEKSNLDWIGGCAQVALQGDALHPYTQEVLYANRWHQKMFGKSSRRASVIRNFSPVHSAPIPSFGKIRANSISGSAIPVLCWYCLIADRVIRRLGGCDARLKMAIDVTAQEEGRMSSQEREEKWQITFPSSGKRAIFADTERWIIYRNPVAEMLTGWVSGESWDKMAEEVFLITNAHTRESS